MLYTTTPTGMRTLAGAYREDDIRRATTRRADAAAKAETAARAAPATKAAPAASTEQYIAPHRIGWLTALLPHVR